MKSISLAEAIEAIELLPEMMPTREPIGPLSDEAIKKLNSAILAPFVSFGGKYHYWYMYHRAAVLFYMVIKDHSMENGNKRSAVVITMLFLYKNKKMFNFSPDSLYEIACVVAESDASQMDNVIRDLKHAFKNRIVNIPADLL